VGRFVPKKNMTATVCGCVKFDWRHLTTCQFSEQHKWPVDDDLVGYRDDNISTPPDRPPLFMYGDY
jgi:hypothetical protein